MLKNTYFCLVWSGFKHHSTFKKAVHKPTVDEVAAQFIIYLQSVGTSSTPLCVPKNRMGKSKGCFMSRGLGSTVCYIASSLVQVCRETCIA